MAATIVFDDNVIDGVNDCLLKILKNGFGHAWSEDKKISYSNFAKTEELLFESMTLGFDGNGKPHATTLMRNGGKFKQKSKLSKTFKELKQQFDMRWFKSELKEAQKFGSLKQSLFVNV